MCIYLFGRICRVFLGFCTFCILSPFLFPIFFLCILIHLVCSSYSFWVCSRDFYFPCWSCSSYCYVRIVLFFCCLHPFSTFFHILSCISFPYCYILCFLCFLIFPFLFFFLCHCFLFCRGWDSCSCLIEVNIIFHMVSLVPVSYVSVVATISTPFTLFISLFSRLLSILALVDLFNGGTSTIIVVTSSARFFSVIWMYSSATWTQLLPFFMSIVKRW